MCLRQRARDDPRPERISNQCRSSFVTKLAARGAQIRRVQMPQELMETILPVYLTIANAEATANHSNLDGIRFGMREDGESVEEVMKTFPYQRLLRLCAQAFHHRQLFFVC